MQQGPGLGSVSMDVLSGLTQTSTRHKEKTRQDSLRQGWCGRRPRKAKHGHSSSETWKIQGKICVIISREYQLWSVIFTSLFGEVTHSPHLKHTSSWSISGDFKSVRQSKLESNTDGNCGPLDLCVKGRWGVNAGTVCQTRLMQREIEAQRKWATYYSRIAERAFVSGCSQSLPVWSVHCCSMPLVWRSEDNFWKLVFSFCHVVSRHRRQASFTYWAVLPAPHCDLNPCVRDAKQEQVEGILKEKILHRL